MATPAPAPRPAPAPTPAPRPTPSATAPANSGQAASPPRAAVGAPPRAAPTVSPSVVPPRGGGLAPAAKKPKASRLGAISRSIVKEAKRFFLYGTRGVGKSTLAADIPDAVIFDIDLGSGHLEMARYPFESTTPTYQDILDAIEDLTVNPHGHKALVIDEASKLEALIWSHVVAAAPIDKHGDKPANIEEVGGGFAKGYNVAEQEWRVLLARLDALRVKRGMHIIILGHSTIATTKNPSGENFDRHVPLVHPKAAGVIGGNADVVAFLTFDDIAKRFGRKSIGVTGRRVIHFEHSATWDAKSRLPLPAMMDLPEASPWALFADALERLHSMSPAALRTAINEELARLGEDFTRENGTASTAASVRAAVGQAGDNLGDLHRYLMILQQSTATPVADTEEPTS